MTKPSASAPTPLPAVSAAFAITAVFFVVELAGGWWTGSLALVADAMHMAVDLLGLGMTLAAAYVSRLPADSKRTFGYQRVEVLAALVNGAALWVVTGVILREAWARFVFPTPVAAAQMMVIAAFGLAANVSSGLILYRAGKSNINARGAFLHAASDALGSLGAIGAGWLILKWHWFQADAFVSVLICVGIIITSYWLLRDSVHILLEGAPRHLDIEEIRAALAGLSGVREVHDLHLWSLTQGSESMSGHVVFEEGQDSQVLLGQAQKMLEERFGLYHVTLQLEKPASGE